MGKKYNVWQRMGSLLLTAVLVLGMVPVTGVSAATTGTVSTDGVLTQGVNTVADPQTLERPQLIYGENTLNTGMITVDKSVSKSPITLTGELPADQATIGLTDPNNFLVTVSQTAQVTGLSTQTKVPVDVVFVLDTSGSMSNSNRETTMVTAVNNAISTLMAANSNNRVGVVAFSDINNDGSSTEPAAVVLSNLASYTGAAATNHLTWDDSSIVGRGNGSGSRDGSNGGTNIQAGVVAGAKMLANATNLTVDGVTRMPFLIILSDGAPTYNFSSATWYDPDMTGSQYGPGNDEGTLYTGNGFLPALVAAYYKGVITEHYFGASASEDNRCSIYTLGVSIDNSSLAQLTMNPKENFNAGATGNTHAGRFASYWRSYQAGNAFNISCEDDTNLSISKASIDHTKNYVNGKSSTGANMYSGGIAYNDGYYSATQTNQINSIFQQVVTEITKKAISVPTKVEGTLGENFSGYVTFHDPIGEYMEVKDIKGIVANGKFYKGATAAQYLAAYGTANQNAEFNAKLLEVLGTRLTMTDSSDVSVADLLATADGNTITWWGHGYKKTGEEEPGMQVLGAAQTDSVEYIEQARAAGLIPATATHVCRSYFFYGTAGDASVGSANAEYLYFVIRVQRSLTAPYQQTVVVSAPASLLSMEKVIITESEDDRGNTVYSASVESAAPARVIYEVGLRSDITAENVSTVVADIYKNETVTGNGSVNYDAATDTYHFFTNDWDRTQNGSEHHRAKAYAAFDAALDNPFYAYQQDTLVVNASGNAVTSNPAGTTAYYERTYYDWSAATLENGTYTGVQKKTQLIKVEIPEDFQLIYKDGKYYIPQHTYTASTLETLGDDILKASNDTNTALIVSHAHRTGEANNSHYAVLLGNNGMLSLKATTPKPEKSVQVNDIVDGNGKPVKIGDILTYTIKVENPLVETATYTITDTVPAGTELVENSVSDGGSVDADGNITWSVAIGAGQEKVVSFQVRVTKEALNTAIVPTTIQNTAVVTFPNGARYTTNPVENPPYGKTAADENGNDTANATTGYKVGDIITYSIRFHNTETTAASITITDKVPVGTVLVEENPISHAENATVSEVDGRTVITWTFDEVQPDVNLVVTFSVMITADAENAVTNSADITVDNNPTITTNPTSTKVEKGNLVLHKTVADTDKQDQTFKLTLTESTGKLNGTYSGVTFTDGVATLTISHGQTVTIQDLPAGVKITVAEDLTGMGGWTPGYEVGGTQYSTAQQVTVGKNTSVTVNVNNDYHANPVTFRLQGIKTYLGAAYPGDLQFSFQAQPCDQNGNPLEGQSPTKATVSINAEGQQTFRFTDRVYTEAFDAPRYYLISEEVPANKIPGMIYSDAKYLLYLNVTDDGQGNLELDAQLSVWNAADSRWDLIPGAQVADRTGSVTLAGVDFTNTYPTETEITLGGNKTLSGRYQTEGEFVFQLLTPGSNTVGSGSAVVIDTAFNQVDGSDPRNSTFTFNKITYTAKDLVDADGNPVDSKTFYYYIREIPGNVSDISYDPAHYVIAVTVIRDGSALSAKVTEVTRYAEAGAAAEPIYEAGDPYVAFDRSNLKFSNEFKVQDTRVMLTGTKTLTGRDMTAGEFSFSVYRADENGNFTATMENMVSSGVNYGTGESGSITFAPIGITVEQMKGTGSTIPDSKDFYFVVVEDAPAADDASFEPNMYYAPTQYLVKVTVTYSASTGELTAGDPVVVNVRENGAAAWPSPAQPAQNIGFTNIQNPSRITVTPIATKIINGANLPNGLSFSFQVVPVNGSANAATGTSAPVDGSYTPGNGLDVGFTSLVYTYDIWQRNKDENGVATFRYWITESNTGSAANGISYSDAKYLYVVKLSRSATNALVVTESYYTKDAEGNFVVEIATVSSEASREDRLDFENAVKSAVTFTNSYDAQASINLTATKVMENNQLLLREFLFLLQRLDSEGKPVAGSAIYGSNAAADMGSDNQATAQVTFATLNYSTNGTPENPSILNEDNKATDGNWYIDYLMYEVEPEDVAIPGVAYDDAKYIVTIKITQEQDGSLTAVLDHVALANYDQENDKYTKGDAAPGFVQEDNAGNTGVTFTNTYSVQTGTTVTIQANKTLTGRDFVMRGPNGEIGEFGFALYRYGGLDGDQQEIWHNIGTAFNDADGNISFTRSFNASTLNHLAFVDNQYTVTYRINEINGGLGGITYSDATYYVDVVILHDPSQSAYTVASVTYKDENGNVVAYTEDGENYYTDSSKAVAVTFREAVVFANDYTTNDTGFQPMAFKELYGEILVPGEPNRRPIALTDNQFSFEVVETDSTGNPVLLPTGAIKVVAAGHNDADGKVIFGEVVFNGQAEVQCSNAGNADSDDYHYHYYLIRENKGTDATVTYSTQNYYIRVAVYNDGNGKLSVTEVVYYSDAFTTVVYHEQANEDGVLTAVAGNENGILFTNHDGPGTVDLNLVVDKKVEVVYPIIQTFALRRPTLDPGAPYEMEGSEFDFEVYEADSQFAITNDTPVASGTNTAGTGTATVPFTTITYARADAYENGVIVSGAASSQVYYYVIKELAADETGVSGVAVDTKSIYVTVTVTDDGYGNMTATPVFTDSDDITGNDSTFTNTYEVRDNVTVTLTAVKELLGKAMEAFTFELKDASGAVLDTKQNVDSEGNPCNAVVFDTLTFNRPGTYVYTVSEKNEGKENMTYDATVYTVTVEVWDDREGQLYTVVTIHDGTAEVELMEFTNRYKHPELTVDLSDRINADKQMRGPNGEDLSYLLENHTFLFEVLDLQDNFILEGKGTSHADGTITFPAFTFKAAGEYRYRISEVRSDADNGITFDPQVWCVHIKVDYNRETGLLEINPAGCISHPYNAGAHEEETAAQNDRNPVFVNRYDAEGVSLAIVAGKLLEGRELKNHEFTFRLLNADGTIVAEAKNHADGSITFHLDYELADLGGAATKDFTYTMVEVIPDTKLGGVSYSTQRSTVTVTVTDSQVGNLVVTIGGVDYSNGTYASGNVFTNTYAAKETTAAVDALKRLDGTKPLGENDYEFRLVDNANPSKIFTAKNDASGKIHFTLPAYTAAGVYTYTLTEVLPGVVGGGMTYDETAYTVTVTVTDDLIGQLHAEVAYSDADGNIYAIPVFTNTYLAEGAVAEFQAHKDLVGMALKAGDFTFLLLDAEGNEVGSATNETDGSIRFRQLVFGATGEYTYTISEVKGDNSGITYDETVYTVTVTVTDENFDGKLDAQVVYTKDGQAVTGVPKFENTYRADGHEVQISAEKVLTGKNMVADEFSFTLVNKDNSNESYTAKNAQDGTVTFEKLTFTETGVYTYLLSEVKGNDANTSYDETVYTVIITVTDDGKGKLNAAVQYLLDDQEVDQVKFSNVYTPDPVVVPLEGAKDLTGRDQVAGEFTFEVRDAQGNLITTGTNTADGKIVFGEIKAYGEGETVLYVTEVAGDAQRVEYDDYTYRVKITVTNNNGILEVKVAYLDGEIVFYNVYLPEVPTTGDNTPVALYAGLLMSSLMALAAVLILFRKKETV